ncbi:MAG: hypothetical protein EHM13_03855 [Acidobacteria bacterium]|nr:MAG: hypothetical protein EHM13_03855 [Acidobacteriota bacterium]
MRRTAIMVGALAVVAVAGHLSSATAQSLVEVRAADTKYRYVDWNYTWPNAAVVDVFYVGVPGSNEFNLGGGYAFKRGGLVLTPLVYAVFGNEGTQRGVKVAVLAFFAKDGWKLLSFIGHYAPVSGDVRSYQVLDTLDLTRTFGTRWEAGVQAGFFRADGSWSTQVGPLLKVNDRLGAWAVSYRFGDQNEFRAGRVLTF